jgi:hypothetical protein
MILGAVADSCTTNLVLYEIANRISVYRIRLKSGSPWASLYVGGVTIVYRHYILSL